MNTIESVQKVIHEAAAATARDTAPGEVCDVRFQIKRLRQLCDLAEAELPKNGIPSPRTTTNRVQGN